MGARRPRAVPAAYRIGLVIAGRDYDHGLPDRTPAFGREQFGSGPYWHEHDRDRPEYDGTTTLVADADRRPYLLLPVVPPR